MGIKIVDDPGGMLPPASAARSHKRVKNPDGSYSSERSATSKTEKGWINFPTMIRGKQLSEDEAKKRALKTGVHSIPYKTVEGAVGAAGRRSKELGKWGRKLHKDWMEK